ncbi:fructosamine kinase family protein [Aliiruegeria lutimaris]|uniref:Fructosamine-3-kinase n=1 Tax=Aliiruegeria lutimaris TaxID=571298 RepID=A0A1G8JU19_9RHOB|nr:fructosamine kinase family protein [Aliiruegeria lutimaris]SDI34631.1 Fructosamine-3-kinase [Aliiruegeria lutimaris]
MSDLGQQVQALFGQDPKSVRPLHGGDLSQVRSLVLEDGRSIVAKTGPLVGVETAMLRAMAAAQAPVPGVLGVAGQHLFLEHLPESRASTAGWAALARGLKQLHSHHGETFGWPKDYAFGSVAIHNSARADWPSFWIENRLLPSLSHLPAPLAHRIEAAADRLPDLLPARPDAALLHGDLWSGNVLFGPKGSAHLIDPACYFGHGEVDLAMLTLFGQPPVAFWQEYGSLEPGAEIRLAAYQLWPALVHFRLFGSGYRGMVEQRLSVLGA